MKSVAMPVSYTHLDVYKRQAQAYGELTIGVLTDEALIKFDRFPTITFDERFQICLLYTSQ